MFRSITRLPRWGKTLILLSLDVVLGAAAVWATMLARVGGIPNLVLTHAVLVTGFAMILVPAAGVVCGLYRPVTRFESPRLPLRAALVGLLCGFSLAWAAVMGGARVAAAAGLGIVFTLMLFTFLVLSRQLARWLLDDRSRRADKAVAIYGAGAAGRELVALLRATREYRPALFIDDDLSLSGRAIVGLPVIGSADARLQTILRSHQTEEILLAIPSLAASRRRDILQRLSRYSYRVRSVPPLSALVSGGAKALSNLKDVSVEDLLGRDPVTPLPGLLEKCITGKVVLVTGGGGSIGSELCRQVLRLRPAKLVILDHSEFALYQIEQELRVLQAAMPAAPELRFVLGSVADFPRVKDLFSEEHVNTVYHAAAYKHVPIVEDNAVEGLRTNVIGTWQVARAAAHARVGHFILISSDKAVRPTNVMGATKRMAELAIQMFAERDRAMVFTMVRFGNVLGSSGSVVPLFRKQIEQGGPITLTHAAVTRYFMTIPEAVELVIQAGAMARGGEVFVLDMGEPVRIKDLAEKMVHLSGRTVRDADNPHGDIALEIVGLRNGEKLYEELLIGGETTGTAHPRIWQVREEDADAGQFEAELETMASVLQTNPSALDVPSILGRWVAGYGTAPGLPATGVSLEPQATLH